MNFEEAERLENEPAPLNIENVDIVAIIAQIEGDGWQKLQELEFDKKDGEGIRNYSILAAQKNFEKLRNQLISWKQQLAVETDPTEIKELEEDIAEYESGHGPKSEIYGAGGINRYFVLSNGNVVISEPHMYKKDKLAKTRQLGIISI